MSGVFDPDLEKIGRAGPTSSKKFRNISRNFHAWINEENKTLPVEVSTVKLRVLEHRPKTKEVARDFPMIGLKAWAGYLLQEAPEFVLGGNSLDNDYQKPYRTFWQTYEKLGGTPCLFRLSQVILGETLCHTACTVTEAEVRPRDQCWSQATKCSFRREDWKQQICMGNLTALV